MRSIRWLWSGLAGGLTALTVVALAYLGNHLVGLPFFPFDLFDWVTRVLPGGLVIATIELMVKVLGLLRLGPTSVVAKQAEQSIAIIQFLIGGVFLGLLLAWLESRFGGRVGLTVGVLVWIAALVVEAWLGFSTGGFGSGTGTSLFSIIWLGILMVGWAVVLGRLVSEAAQPATEISKEQPAPAPPARPAQAQGGLSRRQFLFLVGAGSFVAWVSALGVSLSSGSGSATEAQSTPGASALGETSGPDKSPSQAELANRFAPVPNTRPELTSTADFYRIDINTVPPQVDGNTWRLKLDGLVDHPLTLSLDDLRAMPANSQAITLECISNPIGGDLTSTAVFTGVPFKLVLQQAGVQAGAQAVDMQAVDGFYESIPMAEAMDERTLLVYAMNGAPLPVAHGYPLRIYIPNHFGMKQPKWIKSMKVVAQPQTGYWVERGWSEQAIVQTTSVIDAVDTQDTSQTKVVPVGGIAYAGARGISKVEVQVDGGDWQAAELRDPPLSSLTWVQWRFLWTATPGRHMLSVRCTDGDGALQDATKADTFPNGATGYDQKGAVIV
jgi:DMSO/TMAO reductase YedYZ molybdopterin-dependent catalytic subunit